MKLSLPKNKYTVQCDGCGYKYPYPFKTFEAALDLVRHVGDWVTEDEKHLCFKCQEKRANKKVST